MEGEAVTNVKEDKDEPETVENTTDKHKQKYQNRKWEIFEIPALIRYKYQVFQGYVILASDNVRSS